MHKYFEINDQGHNIRCKVYYKEKGPVDKAVLFCTGFAGHKDNNAANMFADKLLSKNKKVVVVVFNWPAHGDDVKKKLDLNDCTTYLDLVVARIRSEYKVKQLYCYTTSFGGYVVLKYISEHDNPFEKIAIRCPAVNMYDVLVKNIIKDEEYDRIMKGESVLVGFDRKVIITPALLEDFKANDIRQRDYLDFLETILIMHGTADEIVPFEDSRTFAENQLIEFIPIEGADHRFQNPAHMSLANKYVREFFDM